VRLPLPPLSLYRLLLTNIRVCRKLNTSPGLLEDKEALAKFLVTPPVKKIDLHFPLGLEVTARNLKGVTIKDGLDAIYKQFKKKVHPIHTHVYITLDVILTCPGGRRARRKPRPRRLRVGSRGVLHETHCASEEAGRATPKQEVEEEGQH
jgi:hypothetical protein